MRKHRQTVCNTSHRLHLSLLSPSPFVLFLSFSIFLAPSVSFSDEFTARSIGAYGNVAVMEVTGDYDARNPDGTLNGGPRRVIAGEFLKSYQDEYDFLVVFSNFDFEMSDPRAQACYWEVRNDVSGIGLPFFDNSAWYGSNGKLQGMVDMGNSASKILDPLDEGFEQSLNTLGHEIMHRWGAHVRFNDADESFSTALLSSDKAHWSFLLDSRGSVLYGNMWRDNGDGTFTSTGVRKYYSPLDLYLMGLVDKTLVPPILLIDNPEVDPDRLPETGVTIPGTARHITIDDIVAAEGERLPAPSDSQRVFRAGFVFVTRPGTFNVDALYGIEALRNEWVKRYSILTDGQAIVQVALLPRRDIHGNPGPVTPPVDPPRTRPPDIEDGVKWLVANQDTDGSWSDLAGTAQRDTAEAVCALRSFNIAQGSCSIGVSWLTSASLENTDYLSRRIEILESSGQDTDAFVNALLSRRNDDGGWGSDKPYVSNAVDTALALRALSAAEYRDDGTLSRSIEYLKASQNSDGGWGREAGSDIQATAHVLIAFNKLGEE